LQRYAPGLTVLSDAVSAETLASCSCIMSKTYRVVKKIGHQVFADIASDIDRRDAGRLSF